MARCEMREGVDAEPVILSAVARRATKSKDLLVGLGEADPSTPTASRSSLRMTGSAFPLGSGARP